MILALAVGTAYAQIFDFPLTSNNQQLIEEAVSDGFFIVRSRYQLKDSKGKNPQVYGLDGADYFGETFSLGIKTSDGYLIEDEAVRPWLYDERFNEYSGDNRYEPVISEREFRLINGEEYLPEPPEIPAPQSVVEGSYYVVADTLWGGNGFTTDDTDGVKKGWLVWLTAADTLLNDINLLIYRSEQEFKSGKNSYAVKAPSSDKHIVGGIYINPEISGVGKLTFRLSGLLVRTDGQWQIVRTGATSGDAKPQGDKPKTEPKKGLTPVKPSKR